MVTARTLAAAFLGALAACSSAGHDMGDMPGMDHDGMDMGTPPAVLDVAPYEGAWDVARFVDTNSDPAIVEVDLEARVAEVEYLPGKTARAYTYNGTVPGPLLEARAGDRVTVHFTNNLPEPTTIHWHGLRVPAEMDGTAAMQSPVPAGGTFEYSFVVPDAGGFWYHPHVRSDEQVDRGLYGPIVVRGAGEPALPERVVVLDDVLVNSEGATLRDSSMGELMRGRQGNLILANGKPRPVATVRAGERQRWRLVNAANARYFRLALPGHRLTLLGTDGGLLETPREVDELLLVPGERADVVITPTAAPGAELDLVTLPYDRGHGTAGAPQANVLRVRYSADPPIGVAPLPAALRTIDPPAAPARARTLRFGEEMDAAMNPVFKINGEAFPDVTPLHAILGESEEWEVANDTEMDHPFHLHGFFFQVLSRAGASEPFRAWKDTVNVPAKQSLRLAVRLDGHPGMWMYHCHILEHGERGMMGELHVAR